MWRGGIIGPPIIGGLGRCGGIWYGGPMGRGAGWCGGYGGGRPPPHMHSALLTHVKPARQSC